MPNRDLTDAQALHQQLIDWRRDFHRHPELGFQEHRSASVISERLRALVTKCRPGLPKPVWSGSWKGSSLAP